MAMQTDTEQDMLDRVCTTETTDNIQGKGITTEAPESILNEVKSTDNMLDEAMATEASECILNKVRTTDNVLEEAMATEATECILNKVRTTGTTQISETMLDEAITTESQENILKEDVTTDNMLDEAMAIEVTESITNEVQTSETTENRLDEAVTTEPSEGMLDKGITTETPEAILNNKVITTETPKDMLSTSIKTETEVESVRLGNGTSLSSEVERVNGICNVKQDDVSSNTTFESVKSENGILSSDCEKSSDDAPNSDEAGAEVLKQKSESLLDMSRCENKSESRESIGKSPKSENDCSSCKDSVSLADVCNSDEVDTNVSKLNCEPMDSKLKCEPMDSKLNCEPMDSKLNCEPMDNKLNCEPMDNTSRCEDNSASDKSIEEPPKSESCSDNESSVDVCSSKEVTSRVFKRNGESVADPSAGNDSSESDDNGSKPKKAREEKTSPSSTGDHKPVAIFGSPKPAGKQLTLEKWFTTRPHARPINRATSPDRFPVIITSSTLRSPYSTRGISIADERERFLSMSREEKRKYYDCGENYVTLDSIDKWPQYHASNLKHLQAIKPSDNAVREFIPADRRISVDEEINSKLSLFQGSITSLEIDAVVNAANRSLLGGGGIDGAIHNAAGSALLAECRTLGGCDTGRAKTTAGYKLPAKYIIHTVGPMDGSEKMLRSCYKTCFKEMKKNHLRSIAFCCISTGIYGYPPSEAVHVALGEARNFLEDQKTLEKLDEVDRVIFCLFGDSDVKLYETWIQIYFPPPPTPTPPQSTPSSPSSSSSAMSSD